MSMFVSELLFKLHAKWPDSDACVLCSTAPDTLGIITSSGPVHAWHNLSDIVREALEQGVTAITNTEVWTLEGVPVAYVHSYPTHLVVAAPFWTTPEGAPTTAVATEATWVDVLLDLWGYPVAVAA